MRTAKGHVDHFTIHVVSATVEAHLAALGEPYETESFPKAAIVQFNLRDLDGVKVDLTFRDQP